MLFNDLVTNTHQANRILKLDVQTYLKKTYFFNVKPSRNKHTERVFSRKGVCHALSALLQPPLIIKSIMEVQKVIEQSHGRCRFPLQNFSLEVVDILR